MLLPFNTNITRLAAPLLGIYRRQKLRLSFSLPLVFVIALSLFALSCERTEKSTRQEKGPVTTSETTKPAAHLPSELPRDLSRLPSFSALVKNLQPAVVNISTTSIVHQRQFSPFQGPFGKNEPFGEFFKKFFGNQPQGEYKRRGLGSGFIVSSDGYVVTNNHVVDGAKDIEVVLADESKYKAKVVGTDPKTDLALLKIKAPGELPYVKFGNSDALEIGDWVLAIGNPFGLGHTVTAGIVSAKGRVLGMGSYDDFVQTDAPINPGNSGGPLFNLRGEVMGVNTAIIARGQGIGFAIPSNIAENIIKQLKGNGRVVRGWLGVNIQEMTPEIAEGLGVKGDKGVLIAGVTPGSPAAKAGLKRGDIILSLGGKKITKLTDITILAASSAPGTTMRLQVLRDGKEMNVDVKLGKFPESKSENATAKRSGAEKLGIRVSGITPEIAEKYGLDVDTGVVITAVGRGSAAAQVGLRRGDVILEINKHAIKTKSDFVREINKVKKGASTLFLIQRGKNTIFLALRLG